MGLKDTINLMVSEDWKERFNIEYIQLKAMKKYLGILLIRAKIEGIDLYKY